MKDEIEIGGGQNVGKTGNAGRGDEGSNAGAETEEGKEGRQRSKVSPSLMKASRSVWVSNNEGRRTVSDST